MESAAIGMGGVATGVFNWFSNPITQVLVWPLLGCLVLCLIPRQRLAALRLVALVAALGSCGCSVMMLTGAQWLANRGFQLGDQQFFPFARLLGQYLPFTSDPAVGLQFVQQFGWMRIKFGELQSFGVEYYVGVDGLSMPLVLLSTFTLVFVVLWSWKRTERLKEFLALTLFMQTGILGSFVALDYVLLYLFWEWMLIPMFFLIAGWGKDREKATRAAIKFFIYTLAGSVFMLIAFIALQVISAAGTVYTFSIPGLATYSLTEGYQSTHVAVRLLIFLGLLIGFAVKAPMWPFHTWLPEAHGEAPTEMSVVLAALMLKSGTYAFLRCLYPTFPDIAYHVGPVIAACGVIAIVYGAGITLLQTDLKRMVAYSSISHMGFIILGISAMHPHSTLGAMFHMTGHGVIIALLFFLVGWIEERFGTRDIRELAALAQRAPWPARLLTLGAFAGMGFPGLIGFWGELMVLQGTYFNNPQWYTVIIHNPLQVLQFLFTVFGSQDGFLNSELWYSSLVAPGMSGARFLQICAGLAVGGVLISAVYMINMLLKVVYSSAEPADAGAVPQPAPPLVALPPVGELQPALAYAAAETGPAAGGPFVAPEAQLVAATPARRRAGLIFGMEWQYALVLLPLAAAVLLFGLFPQPLIEIASPWAYLLAEAEWQI